MTTPGGTVTKQATVTVTPPPTGTFSASPTSVSQGSPSTLTWTSSNATSASIDNGVGSVTPVSGGSVNVYPAATTTYTLTLTGPAGTITKQATVTVTGFSATIQITGTSGVNLRSLANAAGYNGSQAATITFEVASGVTITGTAGAPNAGLAVDSGAWPTGYTINLTLTVKNGGILRGGGGKAGNGADWYDAAGNGGSGGDAIYCRLPMTVNVNSGRHRSRRRRWRWVAAEKVMTLTTTEPWVVAAAAVVSRMARLVTRAATNTTGPRALVARRREAEQVARPDPPTVITAAGALMAETLARRAPAAGTQEATEVPTRTVVVAVLPATRIRKNGNTITINNSGTITGTQG